MKKFILKLVLFLVILVITDVFLGVIFKFYDYAKGGEIGKIHSIMTKENPEVLILGSSRAEFHYVPSIISDSLNMSVYNAGLSGQGTTISYGFLKSIDQRKIPNMILCEIYPSFDIYESSNDALSRFYPYTNHPYIRDLIVDFDSSEKIKLLLNSYRLNSTLLGLLSSIFFNKNSSDNGFKGLEGVISKADKKVIPTKASEKMRNSKKVKYLRELIKEVQKHNTKIVFLISPMFGGSDIREFNEEIAIINEFNLPILNYLNDERIIYNPNFFQDTGHLNIEGAKIYTKIISEDLKNNSRYRVIK